MTITAFLLCSKGSRSWISIAITLFVCIVLVCGTAQSESLDVDGVSHTIDLFDDPSPRRVTQGYSISNTSLNFGTVELFVTEFQNIHLEWPSPPGTESGQPGVSIHTKCSDESLISFVGGAVINDGVRSATTLMMQFHPQHMVDLHAHPSTVVIVVGSVVAFRLAVRGHIIPSSHHLEAFFTPNHATILHPHETWTRPIALCNPTDRPYHIQGYENTNRLVNVMFVDQHDQVEPSRKNWIIPANTQARTPLGSISVVRPDDPSDGESEFYGFFYLRMRHGLSFAFFYNFTLQLPRPRVSSVGMHSVFLSRSSSSDEVDEPLQGEHRKGEIVVRPVEIFNYQNKPQRILDVLVKGDSNRVSAHGKGRLVPTSTTTSLSKRSPIVFHKQPSSALTADNYGSNGVVDIFMPCIKLIPQIGTVILPGTRGVAAVVVLNLTDCLLEAPSISTLGPDNEVLPTFRSVHRIASEIQVIFADRDVTRRTMDVSLSGWVIAGKLFPARRRSGAAAELHNAKGVQLLEHGFTIAIPTAKDTRTAAAIEPLELLVLNSLPFDLKPTIVSLTNRKGITLRTSSVWSSSPEDRKVEASSSVLNIGRLEIASTSDVRSRVGDDDPPITVDTLTIPIHPKPHTIHCPLSSKHGCLPEVMESVLPVVFIIRPLLVTLALPQGGGVSMPLASSVPPCNTTIRDHLHPASRDAYCSGLSVDTVHFGFVSSNSDSRKSGGKGPTTTVLQSFPLRLTNPHNVSVNILEFIFSLAISERGRKSSAAPFVTISKDSFEALTRIAPPADSHGQYIATLRPGTSVDVVLELTCDATVECTTKGNVDGSFTVRSAIKISGRAPAVQELSLPVAFAVLDDARVVLQSPPSFDWKDQKDNDQNTNWPDRSAKQEPLRLMRNITGNSYFSHAVILPKPRCLRVNDNGQYYVEDHGSFDVLWYAERLEKGYIEGPVATVAYYPTRSSWLRSSRSQRSSSNQIDARSSTTRADYTLVHLNAAAEKAYEDYLNERRIGAADEALDADLVSLSRRRHPQQASSSIALTDEEVEEFVMQVAQHQRLEHCRLSFFPQRTLLLAAQEARGDAPVVDGWSSLLTGEQGIPTFFTEVVDFGTRSPAGAGDTIESAGQQFIRLVNTQPVPVSTQLLLWSSSNTQLSTIGKHQLRDAVRTAFAAFRDAVPSHGSSADVSSSKVLRERSSCFRIPDDVWEKPSHVFTLKGNSSKTHIIPPYGSILVGPIEYHPRRAAESGSLHESHRTVDRDILLLRNNDTTLDAVLVVAKIGKPAVYIGALQQSRKWHSLLVQSNEDVISVPGEALMDALSSIDRLTWNITDHEVQSWLPRSSGFPSWLDIWRHVKHSGSEAHLRQVASALQRLSITNTFAGRVALDEHHLRKYVVRNEFDSEGKLKGLQDDDESPSSLDDEQQRHSADENTVVYSRLPIHFQSSFQVINKGSFQMNITSLTFDNGRCVDGELMMYPCISASLPFDGDKSRMTSLEESMFSLVLSLARNTSLEASMGGTSAGHHYVTVAPRSALQVRLFRMPRYFEREVRSRVRFVHDGSTTLVAVVSSLPEAMFYEMRFTELKTLQQSIQHSVVSSILTFFVMGAGAMACWNAWRASLYPRDSTSASSAATAMIGTHSSSSTTTVNRSGVSATGTTKAQVLAAKKARKEAWELYHQQQRMMVHGGGDGSERASGVSPLPEDPSAMNDDREVSTPRSSKASSRSSSTPPAPTATSNSSEQTRDNINDPAEAFVVTQRLLREHRVAQDRLTNDERDHRDAIVTEQLMHMGKTMMAWNSSSEVQEYHDMRSKKHAEEAAAKAAELELKKKDAEYRRRRAEENIRNVEAEKGRAKKHADEVKKEHQQQQQQGDKAHHTAHRNPSPADVHAKLSPAVAVANAEATQVSAPPTPTLVRPGPPMPPMSIGSPVAPTPASSFPIQSTTPKRHHQEDTYAKMPSSVPPPMIVPGQSPLQPTPVDASPVGSFPFVTTARPRSSGPVVQAPAAIDDPDDSISAATESQTSYLEVQQLLQLAMMQRGESVSALRTAVTAATAQSSSSMAAAALLPEGAPVMEIQRVALLREQLEGSHGVASRPLPSVDHDDEPHADNTVTMLVSLQEQTMVRSVVRGIMGRTDATSPELALAQRLPSDFSFVDEATMFPPQQTAATVGDYNAFFGLELAERQQSSSSLRQFDSTASPPFVVGDSPVMSTSQPFPQVGEAVWGAPTAASTAPPLREEPGKNTNAFNVFGGTW